MLDFHHLGRNFNCTFSFGTAMSGTRNFIFTMKKNDPRGWPRISIFQPTIWQKSLPGKIFPSVQWGVSLPLNGYTIILDETDIAIANEYFWLIFLVAYGLHSAQKNQCRSDCATVFTLQI